MAHVEGDFDWVATPSHARPLRILEKVDTPKPRCIGVRTAQLDEIEIQSKERSGEAPTLAITAPDERPATLIAAVWSKSNHRSPDPPLLSLSSFEERETTTLDGVVSDP
ncbi:hypothetical protein CRG98_004814 [Punica granatum]|uniref:Uncharacterized protein n=1 Tax=Punica granatum TaxID=22663 RepID=A0A2I0L3T7_PUNGR|nr:hypothetical protein CRG98_004814 [Punica granatum]